MEFVLWVVWGGFGIKKGKNNLCSFERKILYFRALNSLFVWFFLR